MPIDLLNLDLLGLKADASTKEYDLSVKPNGKGSAAVAYKAHGPRSLTDAVKMFGERHVFLRFMRSLASSIGSAKKKELTPTQAKASRGSFISQIED